MRLDLRKLGIDEWLILTVMALYTEACTVYRTDAGLSDSFEVKVGLHQEFVSSPLMFSVGMDVVVYFTSCCMLMYGTHNGAASYTFS